MPAQIVLLLVGCAHKDMAQPATCLQHPSHVRGFCFIRRVFIVPWRGTCLVALSSTLHNRFTCTFLKRLLFYSVQGSCFFFCFYSRTSETSNVLRPRIKVWICCCRCCCTCVTRYILLLRLFRADIMCFYLFCLYLFFIIFKLIKNICTCSNKVASNSLRLRYRTIKKGITCSYM